MQCTSCKYPHSEVVTVRHDKNYGTTTRRRECLKCGVRFTTHEKLKDNKRPMDEHYNQGSK